MHNIGIIGDTGMVGSEIDKILDNHDKVNLMYRKNSKREEGSINDCELVFLATKEEQSMEEAPKMLSLEKKVIDLSGAYRVHKGRFESWYGMKHTSPELLADAVYGLPAYNRDEIKKARLVANPGCYPTAIILAINPIKKYLDGILRINATSGRSGARKELSDVPNEKTYNYGRNHKHVPEIEQFIGYPGADIQNFSPIILESVFRCINANIEVGLSIKYVDETDDGTMEYLLRQKIKESYVKEDCVECVIDTKDKIFGTADVSKTHKALVKLRVERNTAFITSMIDNLGKGAASQAVENMNIMLGLPRLYGIDKVYRTF